MSYVAENTQAANRPDSAALKQKAAAAKEAVMDLAGEVKHYATDQAGYARNVATEKVSDVQETVSDYVQKNPLAAIGIAAGVGLLLGLILKRR